MFKFAFLGLLAAVTASAAPRQLPKDPRAWPVVPIWWRQGAPALPKSKTAPMATASLTDCPPMFQFVGVTGEEAAVRYDSLLGVTQVYMGDYENNRVVRHDISSGLTHTDTPLPILYGVAWIAKDLDQDGDLELVLQRGDLGFGGDGFLDILSAPTWQLRKRFVFPGMKVSMDPVVFNLDADPYLEIYLTPSSLGGASLAVIIKYDTLAADFRILSQIPAPTYTASWQTAVGDFDDDGRTEFISGNPEGYRLFEWKDTALEYIGKIGDTATGNHLAAIECHPKPGGSPYVLLGYSSNSAGVRYELSAASGDNTFSVSHLFADPLAAVGITPCLAADVDCDGLDNLAMSFYPSYSFWKWDDNLGQFAEACILSASVYGSIARWYQTDLDQDGAPEFSAIGSGTFRTFPGTECHHCDSTGRCIPRPFCHCPCFADPQCDSVKSDVLDVVQTINVAFRGAASAMEPGCPRERTDVDCTGTTDVLDVVKIVNVSFRAGDLTTEFCDPCR